MYVEDDAAFYLWEYNEKTPAQAEIGGCDRAFGQAEAFLRAWLPAEMLELIDSGIDNIVCVQPFGCLPNHIVGKGMMKPIKEKNPECNIVAVDYDAGATQINQENRIKLMLSCAREKAEAGGEKPQTQRETHSAYVENTGSKASGKAEQPAGIL